MSQEESLFKQIERELRQYKPMMGKAADSILDQEVSNYPIFIIHKGELPIGIALLDKAKTKGEWSINASILEEFTTKQIIKADRVENFREIFKDPSENLCLFVLSEAGANFIFLPRSEEQIAKKN